MRYIPIFLFALFSFSLLACVKDQDEDYSPNENPTQVAEVKLLSGVSIGWQEFKLVGDLTKEIGAVADEMTKSECEKWVFELSALENILSRMEEVSSEEAYSRCYQYPCQYSGTLSDGKQKYELIVHSGGHIVIKTDREGEELNFILAEAFEGHPFFDICDCCE